MRRPRRGPVAAELSGVNGGGGRESMADWKTLGGAGIKHHGGVHGGEQGVEPTSRPICLD